MVLLELTVRALYRAEFYTILGVTQMVEQDLCIGETWQVKFMENRSRKISRYHGITVNTAHATFRQ